MPGLLLEDLVMGSGAAKNARVCLPLVLTSFSLSQQDFKDRIHRQKLTQSKITENRQQIVRARKYYDDYRVQLRAKMMRMRTREEMVNTGFCFVFGFF